ncbi:unnamed protein product [Spirodela intermedia]|uniref:non-specific serine/threonine protein kinase n=1 Tax=Spirodela intermedia TaxID=51605 RepID=A0A7I8J3I5_SPIIN|nr:unnamed protein product [Spirodela intermedia]CAA6664777.1 unnamed protein product [Spirodela intermedia]
MGLYRRTLRGRLGLVGVSFFLALSVFFPGAADAQASPADAAAMRAVAKGLGADKSLGWSDAADPCTWPLVSCSGNRVTAIQIGSKKVAGELVGELRNLTALVRLELQQNQIAGPLPSLAGMVTLQILLLHGNLFSSIPADFFSGMSALQAASLDHNPFEPWEIPASLKDASSLVNFSASSANITGAPLPPGLGLQPASGGIPASFASSSSSSIRSLWLNNQQGSARLTGPIDVVQNMTSLTQLWLQSNAFSGPLPDFSALVDLQDLGLRDNRFTGLVPPSLTSLPSLRKVTLANNLFQGPVPVFPMTVLQDDPGSCDPRVVTLLAVAKSFGYPSRFAENWRGMIPAQGGWGSAATAVGTSPSSTSGGWASPAWSRRSSPPSRTAPAPAPVSSPPTAIAPLGGGGGWDSNAPDSGGGSTERASSRSVGIIVGSVLGAVFGASLIGLLIFSLYKTKKRASGRVQSPNTTVIHPRHSGSDQDLVKITVAGSAALTSGARTLSETRSTASSIPAGGDACLVDAGNMLISIQVLRSVTGDFSEHNILGSGGFGTVYRGELHDGTKIAVKRMESGVMGSKGLAEFRSEIAVLTKVRHRNLVSLLGYCLEGNERLLVYEYMPMGTLSRHLFDWKDEGLKPLQWTKRVAIALDVARGVEYLHNLAHQSFIHRDLKPSNILLGDDLKAKVSDFGLVRLAPDGKCSVETRLAGTFGYLAPEYAVTGRVTTKADVFSFGVILMELITGRKALDESRPEESVHLVSWFRRVQLAKGGGDFREAVDPAIELDEETLASVATRPDMGHAVNVLSLLAELWKPVDPDAEDGLGIDLEMTLPQALKKWQAFECDVPPNGGGGGAASPSSFAASNDTTQTSIPTRPSGFADSFTSADGR